MDEGFQKIRINTYVDRLCLPSFVQEKGFFIEVGGFDGETHSNTLDLERRHGWTGLLIEGGYKNIQILKTKHRKAWLLPNCVSTQPKTIVASFR